jgi:hypothetical protein
LQGLQATFAESVKDLGLQRGIEGSTAKHDRVQRFYGALERADASLDQSLRNVNLSPIDRVRVLATGQVPQLERAIEWAITTRTKAQLDGPRRDAAGYQKGLKDLPDAQAKLAADRAALDQQRQTFERAREAARERERAEREKLEAEREKVEAERQEFEKTMTQEAHTVLERLGLELALHGGEYVGKIIASTKHFALQLTEEYGVVAHAIGSWVNTLKDRVIRAFADDRDLYIGYDREGSPTVRDATSRDLQQAHERAHERALERDSGIDFEP